MLALRQYSLPLILAVALHAAVAWSLLLSWQPSQQISNFVKPKMVQASLIMVEAKSTPVVKPQSAPAQNNKADMAAQKAAEKKQLQKKRDEEKKRLDAQKLKDKQLAESKAREEAAKQRAEAAAKQERLDKLARLSSLSESAFDDAVNAESENLQAGTAEMVAQSYRAGIYQEILQNWSRPPSARNGMKATLLMELIPTGEVISVTITESSGNAAFDRSAEQAVRSVKRFAVPDENHIFEAHFRRVYLLFQPEDLLR